MTPFAFGLWDAGMFAIGGALGGGLAFLALRWRRRRRQQLPDTVGNVVERREEDRRSVASVRVLVSDAKSNEAPMEAQVIDRSKGGVRLRIAKVFANGTVLKVRPANGPKKKPLQVRVRNCLRGGGQWEVGCEFVSPPTAAQRRFLG